MVGTGMKLNLEIVSFRTIVYTKAGVFICAIGMNWYIYTALIKDQRKAIEAPLQKLERKGVTR